MKKVLFALLALAMASPAAAQLLTPAKFSAKPSATTVAVGDELTLTFTARIERDWYVYSSDFEDGIGPVPTKFEFEPHASYELVGGLEPVDPKKKYDDIFEMDVTYFEKKGQFRQKIKVLSADLKVVAMGEFQVCSNINGKCILLDDEFTFDTNTITVTGGTAENTNGTSISPEESTTTAATNNNTTPQEEQQGNNPATTSPSGSNTEGGASDVVAVNPAAQGVFGGENSADIAGGQSGTQAGTPQQNASNLGYMTTTPQGQGELPIRNYEAVPETYTLEEGGDTSIWAFALQAFVFGLLALLTPCVFPMIPMTVTFFTRSNPTRKKAISQASFYGISIILIYTIPGTILAATKGPEVANFLSTHWLPNMLFFAIFIVFAMSFLGMFEITLPSKWVNNADKQADKGGMYGIFFMALTLALVSFSCTGPLVGSLLVEASRGAVVKPVIGMFFFSLALALPFSLFAIFPDWLTRMKSGEWMVRVKGVLGFLELALALKFLSVADQVYHWGLLDREVYLVLWIVIFSMLGFFLLGRLKLPLDKPAPGMPPKEDDGTRSIVPVPRLMLAIAVFGFVLYLIPGLVGAPLKALAGYLPPMSTHDFNLVSLLKDEPSGGLANATCEEAKYAEALHFPHGIEGYFDFQQALACAQAQGKPVFIDFTGHGCVNCREMEARVWSHPEVLRRLKEDFVVVALYIDERGEVNQGEWYRSGFDNKAKKTIGKQNADFQVARFNNNAQPYYAIVDYYGEPLTTKPRAYDLSVTNFVDYLENAKAEFQQRTGLIATR